MALVPCLLEATQGRLGVLDACEAHSRLARSIKTISNRLVGQLALELSGAIDRSA